MRKLSNENICFLECHRQFCATENISRNSHDFLLFFWFFFILFYLIFFFLVGLKFVRRSDDIEEECQNDLIILVVQWRKLNKWQVCSDFTIRRGCFTIRSAIA